MSDLTFVSWGSGKMTTGPLVSLLRRDARAARKGRAVEAHLTGLLNLKMLDLRNTMVTDLALEYLRRLKKLKILNLADTEVSAEGVTKLQQALPNCGIRRWPSHHRIPSCRSKKTNEATNIKTWVDRD